MDVRIYMAGGMSGYTLEEQIKWRNQVKDALLYGDYDIIKKPIFFSPPEYYSPATTEHKSEREAMELMIAKEYHIPVIALNKDGNKLHPWLVECSTRICDSMRELVEHVANFYLK